MAALQPCPVQAEARSVLDLLHTIRPQQGHLVQVTCQIWQAPQEMRIFDGVLSHSNQGELPQRFMNMVYDTLERLRPWNDKNAPLESC